MEEKNTDMLIENDSIAYGNVFSACDFPVDITKQKSVKEIIPKQMAGVEKEDFF